LIYISTDLVHDGESAPYSESDVGSPICYYGETKREGEFAAVKNCDNTCVARIALVYGCGVNRSKCFTESIIRDLYSGRATKLFRDEYRTPVYLNDLTRALIGLARKSGFRGRINIAGPDRLSRYEHGLKIAEIFGFRPGLVVPASRRDVRYGERRPRDCSLTIDLATRCHGFVFSGVEESLRHMREAFLSSVG
jgi:dTDP-4-dehydrorhamnose reductase